MVILTVLNTSEAVKRGLRVRPPDQILFRSQASPLSRETQPSAIKGSAGQISWINAAQISQIKIPSPGSSQVQGPDPASGDKVQSGTRGAASRRGRHQRLARSPPASPTELLCLCPCWVPAWTALPWEHPIHSLGLQVPHLLLEVLRHLPPSPSVLP